MLCKVIISKTELNWIALNTSSITAYLQVRPSSRASKKELFIEYLVWPVEGDLFWKNGSTGRYCVTKKADAEAMLVRKRLFQPMGARNASLAGDSVRVFRRSVRGKDTKQQQHWDRRSDQLLSVIIKTYSRSSSAGVKGCCSARLLTEEWADEGRMVRLSLCLWILGGFSSTGCALWFIVLSTKLLANFS